jgi:pyruvate/2-oxoglutarate dehydrogenase complex dihydrolipoamide acyltransferase (E2) component
VEQRYQTKPFARARQPVVDAGRLGVRRHVVHGLLEIDITHPRRFIRDHMAETGERLSFTGFIISCLAQAVQAHPTTNAYRNWHNQLVLFDDVDVVTLIETKIGGVALPHIIRAANRKSFYDVHREIRAIQAKPKRSAQKRGVAGFGQHAPRFMRNLFYWGLRQNPHWMKRYAGTVVITAVGMFGQGAGWGLGFLPMHTLGLTVGGIAERPALIDGELSLREVLCVTISVDHDIVDGAPAARFSQRFRELVEDGHGLQDGGS